jgi:hypothetical protein
MSRFLRSWWVRVGLGLFVIGAGPLLTIVVLAKIGLWPDPNPNPIGPGLLFALTFYPAVFCLFVGTVRALREAQRTPAKPTTES